jgi:hypothetical protein
MQSDQVQPLQARGITRRTAVQAFGGVTLGAVLAGRLGVGAADAATPEGEGVKVLIGGVPA